MDGHGGFSSFDLKLTPVLSLVAHSSAVSSPYCAFLWCYKEQYLPGCSVSFQRERGADEEAVRPLVRTGKGAYLWLSRLRL